MDSEIAFNSCHQTSEPANQRANATHTPTLAYKVNNCSSPATTRTTTARPALSPLTIISTHTCNFVYNLFSHSFFTLRGGCAYVPLQYATSGNYKNRAQMPAHRRLPTQTHTNTRAHTCTPL